MVYFTVFYHVFFAPLDACCVHKGDPGSLDSLPRRGGSWGSLGEGPGGPPPKQRAHKIGAHIYLYFNAKNLSKGSGSSPAQKSKYPISRNQEQIFNEDESADNTARRIFRHFVKQS